MTTETVGELYLEAARLNSEVERIEFQLQAWSSDLNTVARFIGQSLSRYPDLQKRTDEEKQADQTALLRAILGMGRINVLELLGRRAACKERVAEIESTLEQAVVAEKKHVENPPNDCR
jgi:septal ring factor EnvC (AmiA/AmiB activator)